MRIKRKREDSALGCRGLGGGEDGKLGPGSYHHSY